VSASAGQLALPLRLDDDARFSTFFAAGNEAVVAHLERIAGQQDGHGAWLSGAPASGKSHLLQAVSAQAGDRAAYVPLCDPDAFGPAILEGLERRCVVCIDDIDGVLGQKPWEDALFVLLNGLNDVGGELVVAAQDTPRSGDIRLPDLASRLARLPVFRLQDLTDAGRVEALRLRASHRGLELPAGTARYLLSRRRRDMRSLYKLLDHLDAAAMQAQRRLTIPFVRDVLAIRDTN